jgi:hypothetical protein
MHQLDRRTLLFVSRARRKLEAAQQRDIAALRAWYVSELHALHSEMDEIRREMEEDRKALRRARNELIQVVRTFAV